MSPATAPALDGFLQFGLGPGAVAGPPDADPPSHPNPDETSFTIDPSGAVVGANLEIKAGFDGSWAATLRNGGHPTPYPADATFDAAVWRGGHEAALFAPAVTWIDPAAATFRLRVPAAQSALLKPGSYKLQVGVSAGGVRSLAFDGHLRVRPTVGAASARLPYCAVEDMILYYDEVEELVNRRGDQTGFLAQRVRASDDLDRAIVLRYDPRSGFARVRQVIRHDLLGWDVPDGSATPPSPAELSAYLKAGRLIADVNVCEVVARRAIALVLDRQETMGRNTYREEAQRQRDLADLIWLAPLQVQIDTDGDGIADLLIDRDVTFLPPGTAP